jgi:hypothetical protein
VIQKTYTLQSKRLKKKLPDQICIMSGHRSSAPLIQSTHASTQRLQKNLTKYVYCPAKYVHHPFAPRNLKSPRRIWNPKSCPVLQSLCWSQFCRVRDFTRQPRRDGRHPHIIYNSKGMYGCNSKDMYGLGSSVDNYSKGMYGCTGPSQHPARHVRV